jgi:regulation of enolase protein 1 (concanavalin A-like superfamily)
LAASVTITSLQQDDHMTTPDFNRREFLRSIAAAGSAAAMGGLAAACADPIAPTLHPRANTTVRTINVGSIAALQTAINGAGDGDEIVVADGIYLNSSINVSTSGIVVRAATPGGVFLNGTNAITISANRVVFSGFQFTSGSIAGVVITVTGNDNLLTQLNFNGYSAQKYISIQAPSQRNQISYSNFENKPQSAPIGNLVHVEADATVPGYHRIHRCSFQNLPGAGGDFGNEPIRLSNGAQAAFAARTVVEYCFWNNTGQGDSESISVKCRENVIRYCTFVNNQDGMLVFRNGNDNVAYGNFFIGAGGIRVKEANNIYCYNNYFERSGVGGLAAAVQYDYVIGNLQNINFLHNTFVDCGDVNLGGSGASANTWANNIFKKSGGGAIFSNPNGGTAWAGNIYDGTLGIAITAGMERADPLLGSNAGGYLELSAGSPAINRASASYPSIPGITGLDNDAALLLDANGRARPGDRIQKDIGCVEYATGTITNRPLTLAVVGPSYLGGPGAVPVPPTITTQPQSRDVDVGRPISFQVVASGAQPLAYQWQKGGVDIPGATAAQYSIAAVQSTDAGTYTVRVSNIDGAVVSAAATLTVRLLPAGWFTTDIGSVGIAGSAGESGGNFTVRGSGTGIGGSTDQFRYLYQTLNGDGSITARVASQSSTASGALAGVMIRETTAENAKFGAMVRRGSSSRNMVALRRTLAGSAPSSTTASGLTPPNCWLRITRTGNSIVMQQSSNGSKWTTVATSTISMASVITIGMLVASGSNTVIDTDIFTNVTVVV